MKESLLDQAVNFHRNGELDKAEQLYLRLLSDGSTQQAVIHNLGTLKLAKGHLKSALDLITPIIDAEPHNPELKDTYSIVGTTLYNYGQFESAVKWLESALQKEPDNNTLRLMLERTLPRNYLEPEIFDPISRQTLLRYSPRESESYVYTIDISGSCNLRCPSCPVGNSTSANRTKGYMSVELFQKIINKIKQEAITEQPQIWLYNWGEPLIHPDLEAIIAVVKKAGFSVHISTNLNTENGIKALAKANPDEIKISLSGFTQDTYGETHRRGNINLLKSNMYRLRYFIDKYKSNSNVWVGHHLYKNNHHQIESVRSFCEKLGFQHKPIQAFFQPLEKLIALNEGKMETSDEAILQQLLMDPRSTINRIKDNRSGNYDCELRFNQTVINYDGSVALCCGVYELKNMLGINFIDYPHKEIEEKKYQHPFCGQCRANGCDYSVTELMD